jgi:spore coat polysaccharide biosynthesis protein SpsF
MGGAHTSTEMVLGTAQLCTICGPRDVELILHAALSAGIRWFDAAADGPAERRTGAALRGSKRVRIVTTLAPLEELDDRASAGALRQAVVDAVRRSCTRLGADRLDVLLLHRSRHLSNPAVWNAVKELRDEGVVYDLGVALDTPEEALAALGEHDVRHIQLPFDAIDRRWRSSALIEALGARPEVTVHARSALPQGIDLAEPNACLMRLTRDLDRDSPADLCLAYLRAQTWIDGVVVGVETLSRLALNLALFKRPPLTAGEIAAVDAALPRAERLPAAA